MLAVAATLLAVAPAQASTSGQAHRAVKADLGVVYKARWRHASRRWALCPRAGCRPGSCSAWASSATTGAGASSRTTVFRSSFRARVEYERSWVRRWRRTPSGCARAWGVAGTIYDNDHACNGDMAGDLERAMRSGQATRRAFVHGTNTAGFGQVVDYRCHRRGVSVTCANAMGDAFRVVG